MDQVNDPTAQRLTTVLNVENAEVQVKYADGAWSSDLYLPASTRNPQAFLFTDVNHTCPGGGFPTVWLYCMKFVTPP